MVLNDAMEGERGGKREAQAESSFGLIRGFWEYAVTPEYMVPVLPSLSSSAHTL